MLKLVEILQIVMWKFHWISVEAAVLSGAKKAGCVIKLIQVTSKMELATQQIFRICNKLMRSYLTMPTVCVCANTK